VNCGNGFLPLLYMAGGSVTSFLTLTKVFAFSCSRSCSPPLSRSCLASLSCAFASEGSSVNFPSSMMARFVGAATGSVGEGHESKGSTERTKSGQLSDVGSHSGAGNDTDKGSLTRSYYFGPSTRP
jgi:hypothetical protein